MSSISEEDSKEKNENNQIMNSPNYSQNEEELFFSPNCLLMKSNTISRTVSTKNQEQIFDSDDMDIKFSKSKKKLFSSENVQKFLEIKYDEAMSTEPESIKVRNYNTPKKRYSFFKLVEKDKKVKKNFNVYRNSEKNVIPEKKERSDIYGNTISKKNKKNVKISFIDKITTQPLVNVVEIENFKKYNYINGNPNEDKIEKPVICKCCIIF